MTARFMDGTPYAGLEQEMQRIPGFRPRKSGMVICHLENRMGEGRIEAGRACACEKGREGSTGQEEGGANGYSDYLHQFLGRIFFPACTTPVLQTEAFFPGKRPPQPFPGLLGKAGSECGPGGLVCGTVSVNCGQ